MAKCPQCGKYYDDALSFCLDDGTYLLSDGHTASEMPTADYRNSPTLNKLKNDTLENPSVPTISNVRTSGPAASTVVIVIFLIIGGFVLLGAAGFAGALFFAATADDIAKDGTSNPPATDVKKSPTPLDTLGESIKTDDDRNPDNKITKDPRIVDIAPFPDNTTAPPPSLRERPDNPVSGRPVPKQISGGVLNGKAISLPKPPYPPAARAVRASGSVHVQVLVDESGNVVSASAVSGHPLLRAAAVSAARGAKFNLTMLSGQPVKVSGVITYNFVSP